MLERIMRISRNHRRLALSAALTIVVTTTAGLRQVSASPCPGDCDIDAAVSAQDLMRGVQVGLGQSARSQCASVDQDNDGQVTVDEVVMAVHEANGACAERFAAASASAAREILDAVARLEASLIDINYVANPPVVPGPGAASYARRATEGRCSEAGSVNASCRVDGMLSRFRTVYANCTDIDPDNQDSVVLDGELELLIEDPLACAVGDAIANRTYEVRDRNFELRETAFRRELRNRQSQRLEAHTATLTQRFVAAGAGCAGPNGTTWYDGTLDVFDAAQGVDGRFVYQSVSLSVDSEGSPCVTRKSKSGTIQASSQARDERFTERTKDFTITEQALDADTRSVTMAGDLDIDCLGAMRIETVQPIRFRRGVECPRDGILALSLRDNTVNGVRFTTQGAQGEVELDFGYVIDRNNCGAGQSCGFVRDSAVPSCLDESLDRCRVVLPPNPELGFCDATQNKALRFDGDDVVTFGTVPALAAFTIEAWLRPETGARTGFVAGNYGGPDKECSQGFALDASAGDFCFSVDPAGCGNVNFRCVEREPDGAWHHLAGTYANGELRFYIDGELRQQASGITYDAATHLTAGALQLSSGLQEHYTGELDELRIWNHARSREAIQDTMTKSLTGSESGLVGYWPMDEGQGQTVQDHSPSGHHGVLGSTAQADPGDPQWVQSGVPLCKYLPRAGTHSNPAKSCLHVLEQNPASVNGKYWVALPSGVFEMHCDFTSDTGGWTRVGALDGSASYCTTGSFIDLRLSPDASAGKVPDSDVRALMTTNKSPGSPADVMYFIRADNRYVWHSLQDVADFNTDARHNSSGFYCTNWHCDNGGTDSSVCGSEGNGCPITAHGSPRTTKKIYVDSGFSAHARGFHSNGSICGLPNYTRAAIWVYVR